VLATGLYGSTMHHNNLNNIQLKPFRKGVKMACVNRHKPNTDNLFNQAFNSYLLDAEGRTLKMNAEGAIAVGFDSEQDAIGRSILCVSDKKSGPELLSNCLNAFRKCRMHIVEENQVKLDGTINPYLTFKMPCYDESNNLFGVYGCSITLGQHPLLDSLKTLSTLLPGVHFSNINYLYDNPLKQFNLSLRQQACLLHAIKGKTAKQSAQILGLSHRTVEEYLNNIKLKMGVSTKADMIEKAVEILFNAKT